MFRHRLIIILSGIVCVYIDLAFSQSSIFSLLAFTGILVTIVSNLYFHSDTWEVFGYIFLTSIAYGMALNQNLANLAVSWSVTLVLIYIASHTMNFAKRSWWWSLGLFNVWAILFLLQGAQWDITRAIFFVGINFLLSRLGLWLVTRFTSEEHLRYDW